MISRICLVLLQGFSIFSTAAEIPVQQDYNSTMYWGTYRPNLYFGTRNRSPNGFLSGLMWFGAESPETKPWENIRHTCEESDKLAGYAWSKHDGRTFGTQAISDPLNNLLLTTDFIKVPSDHASKGGDWVVRVSGSALDGNAGSHVSLVYYLGFDHEGGHEWLGHPRTDYQDEAVVVKGKSKEFGHFSFFGKGTNSFKVHTAPIPASETFKIKSYILQQLVKTLKSFLNSAGQLTGVFQDAVIFNPEKEGDGPVVIQAIVKVPFSIEFAFISDQDENERDISDLSDYFGDALSKRLKKAEESVDAHFSKTFGLETIYQENLLEKFTKFGQMCLGNMIGGLGYFYGQAIHDEGRLGYDEAVVAEADIGDLDEEEDYFGASSEKEKPNVPPADPKPAGPYTLFTGVPSRPFFPRGFLWDSGFDHHLLELADPEIALDIIKSWASLIDENGWLPREVILGNEAREKVPQEFQIQHWDYANPPTLITALEKQVELIESSVATDSADHIARLAFLQEVFPKFKRQFHWFLQTQYGNPEPLEDPKVTLAFKWRGRKGKHILTSGMDDYPRSDVPNVDDLHVDLLSWVMYFAIRLEKVANVLGLDSEVNEYKNYITKMSETLEAHWDEESGLYTDITYNDDGSVNHVSHPGYLSLTPLFLGLVPRGSPHLGPLLKFMRDPEHIWSPYGLCSLSKESPFYGKDENYWRGPIWINMNYLALSSLHKHYVDRGPHGKLARKIYNELRENVVQNVAGNYESSGYAWEQYSCDDGKGQRSHPFTGWTSLVLLIMSEKY